VISHQDVVAGKGQDIADAQDMGREQVRLQASGFGRAGELKDRLQPQIYEQVADCQGTQAHHGAWLSVTFTL